MSKRLEVLKNMAAQNPNDSFARYGLAMEYANSGDLENAIQEYQALLAVNSNYSAAYFHGGQTLEKLGRREDARALYRQGIEATTRIGDLHTRSEIQAALQRMGVTVPPTAFRVANTAAVMVTATLPPFAQPGMHLDITAAAMADARNLRGGILVLTSLPGAEG